MKQNYKLIIFISSLGFIYLSGCQNKKQDTGIQITELSNKGPQKKDLSYNYQTLDSLKKYLNKKPGNDSNLSVKDEFLVTQSRPDLVEKFNSEKTLMKYSEVSDLNINFESLLESIQKKKAIDFKIGQWQVEQLTSGSPMARKNGRYDIFFENKQNKNQQLLLSLAQSGVVGGLLKITPHDQFQIRVLNDKYVLAKIKM